MAVDFRYHNSSSDVYLIIRHIISPHDININTNTNVFSGSLVIQFCFQTVERYRFKDSKPHHEEIHTKSLCLKFHPLFYIYDSFDRAVREKFINLSEEFDLNYRQVVITDMIRAIREIIDDDDSQNLKLFVGVTIIVDRKIESSLQLINRMEVDEDIVKDDCVICLEELGMESVLLCTPCSHMFHEDCITTWLENGHSCPICRYELLAS